LGFALAWNPPLAAALVAGPAVLQLLANGCDKRTFTRDQAKTYYFSFLVNGIVLGIAAVVAVFIPGALWVAPIIGAVSSVYLTLAGIFKDMSEERAPRLSSIVTFAEQIASLGGGKKVPGVDMFRAILDSTWAQELLDKAYAEGLGTKAAKAKETKQGAAVAEVESFERGLLRAIAETALTRANEKKPDATRRTNIGLSFLAAMDSKNVDSGFVRVKAANLQLAWKQAGSPVKVADLIPLLIQKGFPIPYAFSGPEFRRGSGVRPPQPGSGSGVGLAAAAAAAFFFLR
jgi:hypothetical protein